MQENKMFKRVFIKYRGAVFTKSGNWNYGNGQFSSSMHKFRGYLFLGILSSSVPFYLLHSTQSKISGILGSGDLIGTYASQNSVLVYHTLINHHFGFPVGQNLATMPECNLVQTVVSFVFYLLTNSVFSAVNLTWVFSFVFTTWIVFYLANKLEIRPPIGYLVAISSIGLPWLTGRFSHWDFLFIAVTLLPCIEVLASPHKTARIAILGFFAGCFGPYLGVFSIVGLLGVCMLSIIGIRSMQRFRASLLGLFAVSLGVFVTYSIYTLGFQYKPGPWLSRGYSESLLYAGIPLLALIPLPWLHVPGSHHVLTFKDFVPHITESSSFSNYSSWTLIFLIIFSSLLYLKNIIKMYRQSSLISMHKVKSIIKDKDDIQFGLGIIFAIFFLFFLEGGLGYLFALTISPSIRAWNRILPIMQLTSLLLSGRYISKYVKFKKLAFRYFIIVISILICLDIGNLTPMAPQESVKLEKNLVVSLAAIDQILPSNCPILQLPLVPYPEYPPVGLMADYAHFTIGLVDSQHQWSYGAVKSNSNMAIETKYAEIAITSYPIRPFCAIELNTMGDPTGTIKAKLSKNRHLIYESPDGTYLFYQ